MYKKPEMIPIFPKSPRMTTIDSKQLALMYSKFCALPEMDHCENDEEILKNRFCDGVTDCTDGSDEQNCGDYGCAKVCSGEIHLHISSIWRSICGKFFANKFRRYHQNA